MTANGHEELQHVRLMAKPLGGPSLVLGSMLSCNTMTPKTKSMHQTRSFMGISQKDNDIFRSCKI